MGDVICIFTKQKWCGGISRKLPHQVNRTGRKKSGEVHGFELIGTVIDRDVIPDLERKLAR